MLHSFTHPFPPGAQVALPLDRPMHLYAMMQELGLLAFVIDQAANHWQAVMYTKGYGPISALQTMLKAHDRRVKLLGLHNPVPAADPAADPPAPAPIPPEGSVPPPVPPTTTPPAEPEIAPLPPEPMVRNTHTAQPLRHSPSPVQQPRLLPLDAAIPTPNDSPQRQHDFRQPVEKRPPEWDYLVT